MEEHEIQKQIIDYLLLRGVVLLRINSISRGHTRAVTRCGQGNANGCADLIGSYKGRFLAVEVKKWGGKPTPEQTSFLDEIRASGGIAILAYSVEDVQKVLE